MDNKLVLLALSFWMKELDYVLQWLQRAGIDRIIEYGGRANK